MMMKCFTMRRLFLTAVLLLSTLSVGYAGLLNKKNMMGSSSSEASEKAAAEAAAMTCDAMMAKSLVAANEATTRAEAERDQFFQDLENMSQQNQELEKELKETTLDLTQKLYYATQELQKQNEKCQAEMQEANDNMALLRDRSERAIYEGQKDATRRLDQRKKAHEKELEAKNAEIESIKQHYDELATAVREEAAANITKVVSQSSAVTAALKEEHAKHTALLQEEMKLKGEKNTAEVESLKAEMAETIQQKEDEFDKNISALKAENKAKLDKANADIKDLQQKLKSEVESLKAEMAETIQQKEDEFNKNISTLKAENKAKLDKANAGIKDLQQKLKTLEKERSTLEKQYKAASEEVARWEDIYGSRSYCNFTFMQEDAVAAAVATRKVMVNEASKMADKATKATQKLVETSVKKAEPHVKKARAVVQERVQPHVDKTHGYYKKHMKPHVDKYITPYAVPLLEKTSMLLNKAWIGTKAMARKAHSRLVSSYKQSCQGTLKRLKEMKNAPPKSMVEHFKQSCRESEKTVNTFLWTLLCIFVFIFRSFLWRKLVVRPLNFIWFFSPLRILFGKRKVQPSGEDEILSEDDTPVASPVKPEPQKKVPPQ